MPYTKNIIISDKIELTVCPCGNSFYQYRNKSINSKKKYCNRTCRKRFGGYRKPKSMIIKECLFCKVDFKSYECRNRKYCSIGCKNKHQSIINIGGNNPNFNPNKNNINYKHDVRWKIWRESVFKRDSYICQNCGQIGNNLELHHIKSKQCYPEFVYIVDNGITLCKKCHRLLHRLIPSNQVIKILEYPISILKEMDNAL